MPGPPRRRFDLYGAVQRLQERYGRRVSNRVKRALTYLLVAAVALMVMGLLTIQVTSKARFCVTCHYMQPYYDSWKTSKHSGVECVDCHFPPGLKSQVRHKFEASVQIVKYVTKQYGTRPWTQIEDSSCLRSGCHVKHTLPKAEVREGVSFDHIPHLTQFRRVTRLRCTSCHSQIVQGNHMVATLSTCYLCHFKDTAEGSRLKNCTTCHKLPIKSKQGEQGFDHKMANDRRVSCLSCHGDVIQGKGEVPRERCVSCHSEPERLAKYDDVEFMHFNHVTQRKVDCLRCHEEIRHGLPEPQPMAAALNCISCHPNQHQATQELYAGIAPGEAEPHPDPMSEARVACAACHLEHRKMADGSDVYRAGLAGCANCHGEKYGTLLAMNRDAVAGLVAQVRPGVTRAKQIAYPKGSAEARKLVDSADRKVRQVERGGGIHNPSLSQRLLRSAAQEVNRAMQLAGSSHRINVAPLPPSQSMSGVCLNCHTAGYPMGTQRIYGANFSHQRHVATAALKCEDCHVVTSAGSSEHGKVKIGRDGCLDCHKRRLSHSPHPGGWRTQHGGQAKRSSANCSICHTSSSCTSCHKLPMPHPRGWRSTHGKVAAKQPATCRTCHQQRECMSCHSKNKPASHRAGGWGKQHGKTTNRAACAVCHGSNACVSCHGGVALPHSDEFKMGGHGKTVQGNPRSCNKCHETPKLCMSCHDGLPPSNHEQKTWGKTHGGTANAALCMNCHGKDACSSCHSKLTKSPHADDWMLEHKAVAKFEKGAKCFLCHRIDYCQQCHEGAVLK